jgi:glycosyltransferase involved in cell wall biosynthesis
MVISIEPKHIKKRVNSEDKPRVLMLGPVPPPMGGMATVLNDLGESALAQRCKLVVFNNGKTTHKDRPTIKGIFAQLKLAGRLAKTIRSEQIQIVHIHTCSGFTFWRDALHILIARILGCQAVCHIHGGRFDEFIQTMDSLKKAFFRSTIKVTSVVIVLSQKWHKKLRPSAPTARWRVVPNGVRIHQVRDYSQKRTTSFLFLGNLDKQKGIHDLVKAIRRAVKKGFHGIVSVAGGETENGQSDKLKRHIIESGCMSRIHLIGIVSGQDKEDALSSADCLVLPSYAEGLPMAILEAMAHGLPVIATRVGAIPEVITDNHEGFLIEPGDIKGLSDRMMLLADDENLRRRMGRAAHKRVKEEYSLDAMVDLLMNIYFELADRNRLINPST